MPRRTSPTPHYDSRATLMHLDSYVLGIEKALYVYLPPEYADAQRRFPVLFLLRGHEREWINPHEDQARGGTTVIDVYERLRGQGRIGPMLLVMPGLSSDDNHVPGMLTDFCAPELAAHVPGIGSGQFARFVLQELLPWVDHTYRTLPAVRGVAGFSLGGMMAVKLATLAPHMFVSVGAYDGTFFYAADDGRSVRTSDGVLNNSMFDAAFNLPRDYDFITANSPTSLIAQTDPAILQQLAWFIQYGPEHIEPWGSNFYRGEHLLRLLRAKGVPNSVPQAALEHGDHTWRTADRHMEETLPLHWAAMEKRGV